MNLQSLNKEGRCPNCATEVFLHGPCGGMAENIRCSECGAEFNFSPPFDPEFLDRNCPAYYHGAFNLRDELIKAGFVFKPDERPWWKRVLGLT